MSETNLTIMIAAMMLALCGCGWTLSICHSLDRIAKALERIAEQDEGVEEEDRL